MKTIDASSMRISSDAGIMKESENAMSPRDQADSLLSKHNGWITIDGENMNRKQAPETYENTNPT